MTLEEIKKKVLEINQTIKDEEPTKAIPFELYEQYYLFFENTIKEGHHLINIAQKLYNVNVIVNDYNKDKYHQYREELRQYINAPEFSNIITRK